MHGSNEPEHMENCTNSKVQLLEPNEMAKSSYETRQGCRASDNHTNFIVRLLRLDQMARDPI